MDLLAEIGAELENKFVQLLYSNVLTKMWRVLFEMMWKNELHHILFSLYAKILQWCTADANREKSEFGLKKEKKGKKDIKKEIKERKNYKKETPTPTLTLSPRFTDTQRENTSASTTGGG